MKLFLGFLAALALAPSAVADPIDGFHTPQWAAQCRVAVARNDPGNTTLTCWTPNDGFYVRMTPFGKVTKGYSRAFRGYRDTYWADGLLSFGENWKYASPGLSQYGCRSRRTGLTCGNHESRGWWLGRFRGFRIF